MCVPPSTTNVGTFCTKGDSLHLVEMSAGTLCPRARCPGGLSARGDKLSSDTGSEAKNWLGNETSNAAPRGRVIFQHQQIRLGMSERLGGGLNKWQLALLVGVPLGLVAVTGGAIYLLARRRRERWAVDGDPTSSGQQPVSSSTNKKPQPVEGESGTSGASRKNGAGKGEASKVRSCFETSDY